ncbi:heme/hemin ABC transporter substrate-binding protein [Vibrio sp. RC27]
MKIFTLVLSLLLAHYSVQAHERIISAGSAITELVYALGASDQLVAVDVTSKHFIEGTELPQVGYHRQLSAEGLLALNPSYLIGSSEMGPQSTINTLKSSNVEVTVVPSGDSIEDLFQRIDVVAKITGTEANAPELKQTISAQLDELHSHTLTDKPKVIFLMLSKGRPANIGGKETTVDTIITLSGANNPASDYVSSYKPASMEAIVEMQPDYLLVSDRAWHSLGGEKGILDAFPLLAATPSAAGNKIIPIPSHALIGGFGLESIQLSQRLAEQFSQP